MPEVPIKQVSTFYGDFGGSSGLLFGNYWGLISLRGPWAGAPGPGSLSRGLWAGVSGPGPLGRGPWAEAPRPRLLGRSPWAEAPGPRQGDGGYGDCVKRCPKWSHELSRKGAEFRDSSKAIFAPSSRNFQGSIFQKKTCMECTGPFQYKKTYCIRKATCMECTGLL